MKIASCLVFVGIAALVGACGGDDEEDNKPAAQAATVNKQLAASTATSTIAATSNINGASGGGASATQLSGVAQSSQSMLTPATPGASTQSVAAALKIGGTLSPLDMNGPGCTCTETSCTFSNCSPSEGGANQFTIDGSYSWGGGHIECKNLKYTFAGSGAGAAVGFATKVTSTLNCDLTVTATSIKGTMQSEGTSETEIQGGGQGSGAYSSSWDVTTTFKDVTFGDSKQPTGGSLHVEGTSTVSAAGQSQSYAGSSDITFPVN